MVIGIPTIRIKLSDDNETGVRKLIITNREETVWYGNIAIDAKGDGVL